MLVTDSLPDCGAWLTGPGPSPAHSGEPLEDRVEPTLAASVYTKQHIGKHWLHLFTQNISKLTHLQMLQCWFKANPTHLTKGEGGGGSWYGGWAGGGGGSCVSCLVGVWGLLFLLLAFLSVP